MASHKSNPEIDRKYYDRKYYAGHLKRLSGDNNFTKVKVKRVVSLLQPCNGELIVDLGCGVGTMMSFISPYGANLIGIDYSTDSLSLAKECFIKETGKNSFNGVCCDGRALALQSKTIDGVMAVDFTEHLDDDFLVPTIKEVYRILKVGGRFVIYTPSVTHIFEKLKKRNIILKEDKSHIGLRIMSEYTKILVEAGFTINKAYFNPTDIPIFNLFETMFMLIPVLGDLAKRRICICGVK